MTATYTNTATQETYRLSGVRNLAQAWDIYRTICKINNWNPATFCSDVRVRVNDKEEIRESAKKMLMSIDKHLDRTVSMSALRYDTKALNFILRSGLASRIGDKVTRKFNGTDYAAVYNF